MFTKRQTSINSLLNHQYRLSEVLSKNKNNKKKRQNKDWLMLQVKPDLLISVSNLAEMSWINTLASSQSLNLSGPWLVLKFDLGS